MSRYKDSNGVPGGGTANVARTAQLINERAHILGLQLQQAALSTRIDAAVRSYGQPTPQQQLHELLRRGIIHADLDAAREEVAALKALLERVQSGHLTSTSSAGGPRPPSNAHASFSSGVPSAPAANGSGSTAPPSSHRSTRGRQASGVASTGAGTAGALTARAAGSKQFSALAADHVRHWLDQAQEAALMLEDLAAPGSIDEWPLEAPEAPSPRPSGGPPVAHFTQRIPPELTALMELPTAPYRLPQQHPQHQYSPTCPPLPHQQATGGPAPYTAASQQHPQHSQQQQQQQRLGGAAGSCPCGDGGGGGGLWDAAPILRDHAAGVSYRVACHESAELMWPALAHGDLVLLLPGRYNWPEGTVLLRTAVRVLGLGRQAGDVVIHNNEEDDVFVECAAGPPPPPPPPLGGGGSGCTAGAGGDVAVAAAAANAGCSPAEAAGVVLENLTLLQLGGYEGALRVLRGRTTLVDVVVQFAMGGLQVDSGAHLVLRNCRVAGGATAGVQVAAGAVLEIVGGCEVSRTGGGDDVVPRDLGGVEVMVPLADYPRLAAPSPWALLQTHAHLLAAPEPRRPVSPLGRGREQGQGWVQEPSPSWARPGGGASGPLAGAAAGPLSPEGLVPYLGSLQPPATVVVGPGCSIQNTRGFAISVVKKRSLAAYHELIHSSGGGGGAYTGGTGGHAAAGGVAGGGGGSGGGGCGLAAALEGACVFVSRGASLGPNNSRGAVGVVEMEYHQLDGDAVSRRTASRHFHAVQLTARQLQEGFSSPGVDWTAQRIRLEGNPVRPGCRASKLDVAATAAAAAASAAAASSNGMSCGGDGASGGGGGRRPRSGVVVGCRTLRQLLCACVARAQRRQRGLADSGRSAGSSGARGRGGSSGSSRGSSRSGSGGSSGSDDDSEDDEGSSDGDSDLRCSGGGTGSAGDGGGATEGGADSGGSADDAAGSSAAASRSGGGTDRAAASAAAKMSGPHSGGSGLGAAASVRKCACCNRTAQCLVVAAAAAGPELSVAPGKGGPATGFGLAAVSAGPGQGQGTSSETAGRAAGAVVGPVDSFDARGGGAGGGGGGDCSGGDGDGRRRRSGGGPAGDSTYVAAGVMMAREAAGMGAGGKDGAGAGVGVGADEERRAGSGVKEEGGGWCTGREDRTPASAAVVEPPPRPPSGSDRAGEAAETRAPAPGEAFTSVAWCAAEDGAQAKLGPEGARAEGAGKGGAQHEAAGEDSSSSTGGGGGARGGAVAKLRLCGGCRRVWYCGRECQRRDWPRHAPECRELRGTAAGAGAPGAVT